MTSAIATEYRLERAAQDERFNSRAGAGMVDASMTDTDEFRAYFGLGEFAGAGVEVRVTFKSFLIARAAERRAEAAAALEAELAEAEAERAAYAEFDDETIAALAEVGDGAAIRELAARTTAAAAELVVAAEVVEIAAGEPARNSSAETLAPVATAGIGCSYTNREDEDMSTDAQDFTAAATDYTVTDAGTITLGRSTFRVEIQDYAATGGRTVWLYGARGAVYFLRGFLGRDTGLRQVISWKSGAPLRVRGNEVRVVMLGDVIEVAK